MSEGPAPLRGSRRADLGRELAVRFRRGESVGALAESVGRSTSLVRRLLTEAGIVAPGWPACLGVPEPELAAVLAARYLAGTSMENLARETGIDRRAVRRLLERAEAAPPPRSDRSRLTDTELIDSYRRGASLRDLADRSGMSYARVRETLLAAGITLRARGNPSSTRRADGRA
ncbi:helix-turn-helix domain-containing protein [Actinokineospora sp. NBRC 105648]|uniref:helix-turn-helix domain-containing protein n=1 Tax=Actinokineospora sp. NBRC 105648 TaxID=3032206 RepID=UPI0024A233F2|nr:helix-turn-helix domain-containing protein [Actinokineospora sp. NBRC 105648]GLZ41960.1 hypothetical protein Acsp05_55840 [Actinokineospora sp. NBRC 105648]